MAYMALNQVRAEMGRREAREMSDGARAVWVICIMLAIWAIGFLTGAALEERKVSQPTIWHVKGIRPNGPGVLDSGSWEPFGYDRDANIVWVKKSYEKGDLTASELSKR